MPKLEISSERIFFLNWECNWSTGWPCADQPFRRLDVVEFIEGASSETLALSSRIGATPGITNDTGFGV